MDVPRATHFGARNPNLVTQLSSKAYPVLTLGRLTNGRLTLGLPTVGLPTPHPQNCCCRLLELHDVPLSRPRPTHFGTNAPSTELLMATMGATGGSTEGEGSAFAMEGLGSALTATSRGTTTGGGAVSFTICSGSGPAVITIRDQTEGCTPCLPWYRVGTTSGGGGGSELFVLLWPYTHYNDRCQAVVKGPGGTGQLKVRGATCVVRRHVSVCCFRNIAWAWTSSLS